MELSPTIRAMQQNSRKAEAFLKLLANANRLMILCHLNHEDLSVNELTKKVGLSQSALSQHLAKMRRDKLVIGTKKGQSVIYSIARPEVGALLSTLYLLYCRH